MAGRNQFEHDPIPANIAAACFEPPVADIDQALERCPAAGGKESRTK
jgi:hypothetical protein